MEQGLFLRLSALVLGLWIALAPAVIAVPAAAMTTQASMSDDVGEDGCDACLDMDVDQGLCAFVCASAAFVALAPESGKWTAGREQVPVPASRTLLLGQPPTLDPAPPKPALS